MCRSDENGYTLDYLLSQPKVEKKEEVVELKYIEDTNGSSDSENGDVEMNGFDGEWHGVEDDSE